MNFRLTPIIWISAGALWVLSICLGFFLLMSYEFKSGDVAVSLARWPKHSSIQLSGNQPTLLMFIHPQCPCSRASLDQLQQLLDRRQTTVNATVVFVSPKVLPKDWSGSDLQHQAQNISGVRIFNDIDGRQADIFGAVTSGQTYLYDSKGQLLYSGGVTKSRGQVGANANADALELALSKGSSCANSPTVFGCRLFSQQDKRCHASR